MHEMDFVEAEKEIKDLIMEYFEKQEIEIDPNNPYQHDDEEVEEEDDDDSQALQLQFCAIKETKLQLDVVEENGNNMESETQG